MDFDKCLDCRLCAGCPQIWCDGCCETGCWLPEKIVCGCIDCQQCCTGDIGEFAALLFCGCPVATLCLPIEIPWFLIAGPIGGCIAAGKSCSKQDRSAQECFEQNSSTQNSAE